MPKDLSILIIGGGVAGLATGAFLKQRTSHHVEVIEKTDLRKELEKQKRNQCHDEKQQQTYGIALGYNGTAMLSLLGIGDHLEELNGGEMVQYRLCRENSCEGSTEIFIQGATYGTPSIFCRRGALVEWLLRKGQEDENPILIHPPTHIVEINTKTGTARTKDGCEHAADLIICADGIAKAGRNAVIEDKKKHQETIVQCAYICVIPPEAIESREELLFMLEAGTITNWIHDPDPRDCDDEKAKLRKQQRLILYPVDRKGTHQLIAYLPADETKLALFGRAKGQEREAASIVRGLDSSLALEDFSMYNDAVRGLLSLQPRIDLCLFRDTEPLVTWRSGKAILIGDAAHAALPHTGQGTSQALEDAEALSYMLAKYELDVALERFEALRLPRSREVQDTARIINGTLTNEGWNGEEYYHRLFSWKGAQSVEIGQPAVESSVLP